MNASLGSVAALATAVSWTITALAFEHAGKRIGSMALNFLRLILGCLFLGLWCLATRGSFFPFDAPLSAWLWLGASGLVGLVLGDLLLFQAFIDIGARVSMLVYATAPAFAALLGFAVLGERIAPLGIGGMVLTLAGIALVVTRRKAPDPAEGAANSDAAQRADERRRARRIRGLALAFGGALGQAGGLILSKVGAGHMDPFAGTQIRVSAAVIGFAVVLALGRGYRGLVPALKDGRALASLGLGSFFGPFLGVSLSLLAVQNANAGVASAMMSIMPVLIIAPSAIIHRERIGLREVLGSLVAIAGVFLLFLAP